MNVDQDSGDFFSVAASDLADRNKIAEELNADIDEALNHCVAGDPPKVLPR